MQLFFSSGTPAWDLPEEESTPLGRYIDLCVKAGVKSGRRLDIAKDTRERLEAVGYVDIVQKVEIWPVGSWPKDPRLKEIGTFGGLGVLESLEAFSLGLLTRYLGFSVDEVKELCDQVREELLEGKNKYYFQAWFIYGRKPYDCAAGA